MLGLGKLLVTAGCRLRKKWIAVVPVKRRKTTVPEDSQLNSMSLEEVSKHSLQPKQSERKKA